MMKAAVNSTYGSPEVLELTELPVPDPKENEVLVKIMATTVTSVDCTFRNGNKFFARLFTGIRKPKNPVLGSDFSGVIEKVGEKVTKFEPGDAVFGGAQSTHAEYITIAEEGSIAHKPNILSFEEAAAVPYGVLTALPFLRDTANIQQGQQVLVNGASGSVGTYAVQLAKYYGAHVTGVCSGLNTDLVRSLGADPVIDYKKNDFTENGEQYDIIFDTVGKSSYSKSKRVLKSGGIYLTTVLSFTILRQMFWTSKIGTKRAVIKFTGLRPPEEKATDLHFITELLETRTLKPIIDRRYPLEQIAEAHRYVEKGHKKGNVVINITGDQ